MVRPATTFLLVAALVVRVFGTVASTTTASAPLNGSLGDSVETLQGIPAIANATNNATLLLDNIIILPNATNSSGNAPNSTIVPSSGNIAMPSATTGSSLDPIPQLEV
ncbi:Aste57867_23824 [Aphanomyces stellatus]|uniref:Aste57867_23824 protein n=1 Tax=Aphanomyces stellatus TaxID=120398 RepID=A0A485LNV4_9STRA|nr:hypothetical protein As57867_023751 [Aphanomyces stellatus]VFU00468.1 Aste57867_23824 [Aphanomyces stellatus]